MAIHSRRQLIAALALAAMPGPARSDAPTTIPFDDQAGQVAVETMVKGKRLTFIVDTAVTPSVIDLALARSLGLSSKPSIGQAGGTGTGTAAVYPAELRNVQIGRTKLARLEAVAFDMQGLSEKFGRPLHGVLGESFLKGRILLIDYARQRITMFESSRQADKAVRECARRYRQALDVVPGDVAPRLNLTIGRSRVPVSLDTGSVLGLELYDGALGPGEEARLLSNRTIKTVRGARGDASVSEALLNEAVRLGPFRWNNPTVVLSGPKGSAATRLGNLGNGFLKGKKLLLNYKSKRLGLYDRCKT